MHGHVPVPVRRRPARRPPAGLHRHRLLRPVPADGRLQRAAPDGLRRVRPARRAVRGADRHPPADHHRGQRRALPRRSCAGWAWPTTTGARVATTDAEYYRWTQWIFLQIFNSWYDPEPAQGPPDRRADRRVRGGRRGRRRTAGRGRELSDVERRQVVDDHRLAYVVEAPVNWCPGLGTVLANEEVTADGRSERGNFPVFKRSLKQWMMRITAYGDRLLDDLDTLDWPEPVKLMQRNWIGRSTRRARRLPGRRRRRSGSSPPARTPLFGATYMVLAPEHELVDALVAGGLAGRAPSRPGPAGTRRPAEAVAAYRARGRGEDRGGAAPPTPRRRPASSPARTRPTRSTARRSRSSSPTTCWPATAPARSWRCPARTSGTGSSPRSSTCRSSAPCSRRTGFDGKAYTGEGPAINSGFLDGLGVADAKATIIEWLEDERARRAARSPTGCATGCSAGSGTGASRSRSSTTRPACRSRCPSRCCRSSCPRSTTSRRAPSTRTTPTPTPETPLSRATDWVEVELDLGDGPKRYTRETNTMPQWAGSCWYELRYLDPHNDEALVDPENERYWMGPQRAGDCGGVDLYVGGVEHAVLHLLYARFWHKVLFDLGHVSSFEPFRRAVQPGLHPGVRVHATPAASYVPAEEVVERDGGYFYGDAEVNREYGKMGKSLKNVVTPDEMCDAVRRRHVPGVRDVDGPAGRVPPVGDPGGRRLVPVPAAGVAAGRRRADRRGPGRRRAGRTTRPGGCCTGSSTASAPTWTSCGSTPRSPS